MCPDKMIKITPQSHPSTNQKNCLRIISDLFKIVLQKKEEGSTKNDPSSQRQAVLQVGVIKYLATSIFLMNIKFKFISS